MIVDGRTGVKLPAGVWFREEVREMTIFAEQYDFVITLLLLPNHDRFLQLEADPEEDVFDHIMARSQS